MFCCNGDVNERIYDIEKPDFIIYLLKDKISSLEQQLIKKKCTNRFFCKAIATYSDNNNNGSINEYSKSMDKNKQ